MSSLWEFYQTNNQAITPLLAPIANLVGSLATLAVGIFVTKAALKQAGISARQAQIAQDQAETARKRHEEQTEMDRRRRHTEMFSAAVGQLSN